MKKWRLLLLVLPVVAGVLYLRSLASWRPRLVLQGNTQLGSMEQLVFSPDGQTLFVATGSFPWNSSSVGSLSSLYALDTGSSFVPRWQWSAQPGPGADLGQGKFRIGRRIQYNSHDSHVFLDGAVQIWDAGTGKVLMDAEHNKLDVLNQEGAYPYDWSRTKNRVSGAWRSTMSPDEKWLVSASPNDRVSLFRNSAPGQGVPRFSLTKVREFDYKKPVNFAFSPDGKTLVIRDGAARAPHLDFYDTTTWKLKASWTEWKKPNHSQKWPEHESQTLQWSPNGRFLFSWWVWDASTSRTMEGMTLWRMDNGKKLASSQSKYVRVNTRYELQNDGRILTWGVTTRQGTPGPAIHLSRGQNFDFDTKPLLALPKEEIYVATLSPDSSYLVAGTKSGRVYTQRLK